MPLSRRNYLQHSALAIACGVLPWPGLQRLVFADDAAAERILVVLHLRGGCDGLNLLSPASDADFIAARNSDLRVLADGPEAGHLIAHAQSPAVEFRLHHAAGALAELYDSQHLAFVHAAGLTDTTRSHFVATDMIEHGVADGAALNRTGSGWLARAMLAEPAGGAVRAVSTSGSPSGVWSGDANTISVADLANGLAPPGGAQTGNVLERLYAGSGDAVTGAGRIALDAMHAIDTRLPRDAHGKYSSYVPQTGVNYEAANELGRPLKTLAQLIKMDLGLQAATVDLGGWDTHEFQPGRFKNQVDRLSQGLGAFYNDMARYQSRLVVVVVTEFGRRLRSNRSNGTDHGRGSVMMVLGGGVAGGRIHGRWPGLKSEELEEGVDLAVANDYRQCLVEISRYWRGAAPGGLPARDLEAQTVFPGFAPAPPLGLFGSAFASGPA